MIDKIINQIQIKLDIRITKVTQINTGYVNDVYLIWTAQNKYILKCFLLSNKDKINLSIELQNYMFDKGLSPEIIIEGRCNLFYIVQEYINNQIIKKWYLFGKTLGLLHYNLKMYHNSSIKDFLPKKVRIHDAVKQYSEQFKELLLLKEKINKLIHFPELESKQLIHGDYTWKNILQKDRDYQVIDFDEAKKYYAIYDVAKVVFDLILDVKDAWKDINDFIYGYQSICPINAFEKQEFLNIYAYTLSKDFSGIDGKPNKNVFYLERRISKHKNVLECFDEYDEIVKRLNW